MQPLTTGHRSTRENNSFISSGCGEAEIDLHTVRSTAYLTKVFPVGNSRSRRKTGEGRG